MEIVLSIQFITGIVFVLIGIILLYLVKQGRNKLIVQDQVRLTIGSFECYFMMLFGFIFIAYATMRNLISGFPSWGTINILLILLVLVLFVMRNRNKK